ncbi:hypothetical protein [Ignicoccus hospitalis]|uniref:B-block binding subunit of TFIIIC domain-containing protein n=1 Tax=Ignicoccus hospitalis (strain KIN4/I / DSM 18386 / JCM 14125) TaxID=453591 RepID=A8A8Z5_IGNH4|nr:hypothetical protein [Ignicoccus hospitalis]ABU81397.1 hypothetical protein Igni_0213 [Ignicoccus hospitalis KIN4/I]HIH90295.1 Lrp/AsnC family transcriptional regulator [Desulfurococcaceae archaeon]
MSSEKLNLTELEKKALKLIIEAGKDGLLQQDLWKKLNIDSRDGSRIALRLAKKKLIHRELVTVKGRKTYRLTALVDKVPEEEESEEKKEVKYEKRIPRSIKLDVKVRMGLVAKIPCTSCPHANRCGPGNFFDPATCTKLGQWLEKAVKALERKSAKRATRV